ncbi:MAG: DUF4956 domain-containing protein [Phycisphaerae bacterium]|nr:DUF4956 domain-containing protein [Phycisphaerae bacterium]
MEEVWYAIDGRANPGGIFTPESVLLSLLLAFVLGQSLAWVYYATHTGLSYSRSFVQSLVIITVVVSMVMAVIGNSIVTAFGLMGALAIIRFRNIIKDTRDVAFIFCSLVVGMAAGSQRYAIAMVGTIVLCLIAVYLRLTSFGSHRPHNAFLRFDLAGAIGPEHPVPSVLRRFCTSFSLVSMQDGGPTDAAEYAYQLMIRDCRHNEEMLSALETVVGIGKVSLTMQEELLEV